MDNKKKLVLYTNMCTGCGLCSSIRGLSMTEDDRGFLAPSSENITKKDIDLFEEVCPASGKMWRSDNQTDGIKGRVWGRVKEAYIGWSKDNSIRYFASSGGMISSICIYLLENGIVDGIIQIKKDSNNPYKTMTCISRNRDEVLNCMGSRYSASSPLISIKQQIELGKRYCLVGKPCDIYSIKAYQMMDKQMKDAIPITLSFFCAGMPSEISQKRLLGILGCSVTECMDLIYRGSGWPGRTTAKNINGEVFSMSYERAWGDVLGRDTRSCCRFCVDGIGEFADISCGDGWNIKENKPDFSESDGRNIVFANSDKGIEVLKDAEKMGYIDLNDCIINDDYLRISQPFQYDRRTLMKSMIIAMKLFGRPIPNYPKQLLNDLSKNVSKTKQIRRFFGTVKRVLMGRI